MPRISDVIKNEATVLIPAGDEHLSVTYRPSVITPSMQEGVMAAERTGSIQQALYGPLEQLIVTWDLTDDDGVPYGTTEEALKVVPTVALVHVLMAIFRDLGPNGMRGSASANGSNQTAVLAGPPNGTATSRSRNGSTSHRGSS